MWLQPILLNTFYVSLFLLSTTYIYFKYIYYYWAKRNVPYLEATFPVGNVKSIMLGKDCFAVCFQNLYNALKKKTKDFGGAFMFSMPVLIVMDPEIIKSILAKEFANFADRPIYTDEPNDPLGVNLLTMKGLRWKLLRAKITPTFTSGKMKMMFQTIVNCTNELGSILNEHADAKMALDIRELLSQLTTDIIASCAFGLDSNSLRNPDNEFRNYGKKIFAFGLRDSVLNMMSAICPALLKFFKIPITKPEVTKFFMNILNQTIEYREKNNITRDDFLDLLIRLKNKQSILDNNDDANGQESGITFNELAAQAFTFFGAGFETSSTTLNFCLYELCNNSDIQENVRSEVNKILAQHNGVMCYEAVMEMKYMDKLFNEVLRKYPPISMVVRECTADYKMPNSSYICEKGTAIIISTLGLHRDPEFYPDPDTFDPERFNDEEKSKRHQFTYLPFGEGPRICIARRFALLVVKIVLATLIKDYKFSLHPKTKTPIQFDPQNVFLCPVDAIWLEITKILK